MRVVRTCDVKLSSRPRVIRTMSNMGPVLWPLQRLKPAFQTRLVEKLRDRTKNQMTVYSRLPFGLSQLGGTAALSNIYDSGIREYDSWHSATDQWSHVL